MTQPGNRPINGNFVRCACAVFMERMFKTYLKYQWRCF